MTKGDITLHPTKGVNPHLTFCPRCGGDSNEIVLLGANDKVRTCPSCGAKAVGFKSSQKCPKCKHSLSGGKVRTLDDHERLPGGLCSKCEEELKKIDELIKDGAVHIKCKCGMEGILGKEHPLAIKVREHYGFHNGEPCGVQVERCPQCEEQHDGQTGEADQSVGHASEVS